MARNDSKQVAKEPGSIKVGAASAAKVAEVVQSIVEGQKYPFMAQLGHKSVKPLVVPSTGLVEAIARGTPVEFKVKNYEQAWVVVTDLAALAKRSGNVAEDFAEITVQASAAAPAQPSTPAATGAGSE